MLHGQVAGAWAAAHVPPYRRRDPGGWLDDFGSGYNSFEMLKHTGADGVKIGGAHIRDLQSDPVGQALVEAICKVGIRLGIEVVAEGVEDARTVDLLTHMGVHDIQGHFYSVAVPAAGTLNGRNVAPGS